MTDGIGLGRELGLRPDEEDRLVRLAADLGYTSAWTNARADRVAFDVCARWAAAEPRMVTGTSVVPALAWDALEIARLANATSEAAGARFILGIGSGRPPKNEPVIAAMRRTLRTVRDRVAPTATYLAALGPQMLRLAGEGADGAALNWCSASAVVWSRERIAEGAARAKRDPAEIRVVEYIRVCIDPDEGRARLALAKAVLGYAMARPGERGGGYRAHFARMGFDAQLTELEARRAAGATDDELAARAPRELLDAVGYAGKASGARAAFRRLAEGLDVAIARVVVATPGDAAAAEATLRACAVS